MAYADEGIQDMDDGMYCEMVVDFLDVFSPDLSDSDSDGSGYFRGRRGEDDGYIHFERDIHGDPPARTSRGPSLETLSNISNHDGQLREATGRANVTPGC